MNLNQITDRVIPKILPQHQDFYFVGHFAKFHIN